MSETILTPPIVWSSTSTAVAVLPPYNYILKSSNFSFNGNRNTWDTQYWHNQYAYSTNHWQQPNYQDHEPSYYANWIPALEDTYIYYGGDAATGASPAQTGLTEGYTDNTGGNSNGYKTHSGGNYFNGFVQFENHATDYPQNDNWEKNWKYIEIPNLEDNTQYTLSVFTLPIQSGSQYYSSDEYADGFYLMFHDDSDGKSWGTGYVTNWTNAQKSTRFYLSLIHI